LNVKSNDTELNNTLWNSTSRTFNNRRHDDTTTTSPNRRPLHSPDQLPPLTSKFNPVDDPSTEISTWDQKITLSMFSMTTKYNVRVVGGKGISLEIVPENIDTMGDDTCQSRRERTPWNRHTLLIGNTINWTVQDFKQNAESPQHSPITSTLNVQSPTTANPYIFVEHPGTSRVHIWTAFSIALNFKNSSFNFPRSHQSH
jgi:hypothetical protein